MPNTVMLKPTSIQIRGLFNGQAVTNVSNSPGTESSSDRAHGEGKPQSLRDEVQRQAVCDETECQHANASCLPCCDETLRCQQ
jgi:hypothetical protein